MKSTKFKLNDKTIAHVGRPEQRFHKGGLEKSSPWCETVPDVCDTRDDYTCIGFWASCVPTQCDDCTANGITCESFWDDCDIPCGK